MIEGEIPVAAAPPFGVPTPHLDSEAKLSGMAIYPGDVVVAGAVAGAILRSPHAHAEIVSIDASHAERAEGVLAVVTASDLPDHRYAGLGGNLSDRPPLARGRVRYRGEEVAAIAAETAEQAERALSLIRVRYRRRRPVFTVREALAPRAPRLHDTSESGNVARSGVVEAGAPPKGEAAARVSATYRFGAQAHACMEPHTVLAWWREDPARLDLWLPSQGPYNVRKELAHVFDLPLDAIRTHEVMVGGDFGSHAKVSDLEVIAAALSRKAGRPVRLRLSREDEFRYAKHRYPFDIDVDVEGTREGRLLDLRVMATTDMGAYSGPGAGDLGYVGAASVSLYSMPHVRALTRGVYTNRRPPGSFRGAGAPQAAFARECAMDELARALGLDPVEVRLANLPAPGEQTPLGWRIDAGRVRACIEEAARRIGWGRTWAPGHGVGIAVAVHVTGVGEVWSNASVEMDHSGRVTVRCGIGDPGTGQKTVLAQVAAAELGVDLAAITVVGMDPAVSPDDIGAGASRATYASGNAVGAAAATLAADLRARAAGELEVPPASVRLTNGHAESNGSKVPVGDLVAVGPAGADGVLRAEAHFSAGQEADGGDISDAYACAAQAVEVAVDEALGTVRVVRAVSVHDSGRIVNPLTARGQVEGGIAMAIGAALSEELVLEGGRMANADYSDYPVPRADAIPEVDVVFLDGEGAGRYATKGLAEVCLAPTAAAIANAVADATGLRFRTLPITPDRVVDAVRARDGGGARPRPLWRRPGRWWIGAMRALYPLGVRQLLDRTPVRRDPTDRADAVVRPTELPEALGHLRLAMALPLAGGTDLLVARAQGLIPASATLVDLTGIRGLTQIDTDASGGLRIGAAVPLRALTDAAAVPARLALGETAASIASGQVRNIATVGGNLAQQKRCWFYRHGFDCYKRAGSLRPCYAVEGDHRFYHAALGAHRCQAVTPSDLATTLVALTAETLILDAAGRSRRIPVQDLYSGPGETVLAPGDLLAEVVVPGHARDGAAAFEKLALWSGGFAVVSAAAWVVLDAQGRLAEARVALGGVAPVPFRASETEKRIIGLDPDAPAVRRAAAAWTSDGHPLARNGWKLDAASELVRRSVARAAERARELR